MSNARRILIVLLLILLVACAAIALLPWFVGMGLGHGMLRARLDAAVSGGADFDGVSASWWGEQRIDGLVLTADDGETRVSVDVVVRNRLLDFVGGLPTTLDVSVAGSASGRLDASGRPSFGRLPAGGGDDGGAADADGGDGDGPRVPVTARLQVDGLTVDLAVPTADGERPLQLKDLRGLIELVPGGPVVVQLASPTVFDGVDGSLEVDLSARDLVAADGQVTLLAAEVDSATVRASGVPVPMGAATAPALVERFELTLSGALGGRLDAALQADARIDGAAGPSRLVADVRIEQLVRDGRLDVAGAAWSTTADGTDVPTAPLEALLPMLAAQGIDLTRDVGPTASVRVAAGSAPGEPFSVDLRGAAATLVATGTTAESGRIDIERATLDASLRPALLAHHAPVTLDRAVPFRVVAEAFTLDPAAIAEGALPPVQLTVRSEAAEPFTLTLDEAGAGDRAAGEAQAEADADAEPTSVRLAGFEAVLRPPGPPPSGDDAGSPGRSASVSIREVLLSHAALASPVRADALLVRATQRAAPLPGDRPFGGWIDVQLEPAAFTADGAVLATVSGAGAFRPGATGDGDDDGEDATALTPPITLTLAGANPTAFEGAFGLEAGAIEGWTRGAGDIRLVVEPADVLRATATLAFPGLDGAVAGQRNGERLDLELTDLTVRPAPERLALFTDPGADRPPVRLTGNVALTASGRLVGLAPDRLGGGDPLRAFDSLRFDLTSGPLTLVAAGEPSTLPSLAVGVSRGEPGAPLQLTVRDTSAARPAATGAPSPDGTRSSVAADLRIMDLERATAGGAFDATAVRLDGTVRLERASSALLDALFGTGDLVASSIGPRVTAALTAAAFGRDGGTLGLEATGSRGRVTGTVRGQDGAFVVDESAPVVAVLDLHPVLQRKVLSNIQPIFAGVSSTDGPITIRVTSAMVPLSDGASAASAEFETSGGTLFMQPGFDFLSLVSLFDAGGEPLEATLEPISGRLRAGRVITDGGRLVFTKGASIDFAPGSSVDLETRTLDIRASMPLRWLGSVVREARAVTTDLTVPLVARGPVSTAELKLDPSFDLAGALLEAGVGSLLERELERAVPGLGDLLRGIGGGGRRGGGG